MSVSRTEWMDIVKEDRLEAYESIMGLNECPFSSQSHPLGAIASHRPPRIINFIQETLFAEITMTLSQEQYREATVADQKLVYVACMLNLVDVVEVYLSCIVWEMDGLADIISIACRYGCTDIVSMLILKGALLNRVMQKSDFSWMNEECEEEPYIHVCGHCWDERNMNRLEGYSPLSIAATYGNLEIVTLLLTYGVDVNGVDKEGKGALWRAASKGNIEIAEVLLSSGAYVNQVNEEGESPLSLASQNGNLGVARTLLFYGANVNQVSSSGNIPLHLASWKGHVVVLEELLSFGADMNHVNNEGMNPLHIAIEEGNLEVVKLLLFYGMDINHVGSDGAPLSMAIECGSKDIVDLLITLGAEIPPPGEGFDRTVFLVDTIC